MLPGGLSVIGIYAYADTTMMKNAQAKLRQVLFATYKALKKQHVYGKKKDGESVDWAVLQIDASAQKYPFFFVRFRSFCTHFFRRST